MAYDIIERNMLIDEANPDISFLGWYEVFANVGSSRRERFLEAAPLEGLSSNGLQSQQRITGIVRESVARLCDFSGNGRATGGWTFLRY